MDSADDAGAAEAAAAAAAASEILKINEIEEITSHFLNNVNGLFQFYKDADADADAGFCDTTFSIQIKTFLLQYENKPKKEIICELLTFTNTWDNYRISIIYLIIIKNIKDKFHLESLFINNVLSFLFSHIMITPTKRRPIKTTIVMFNNLIDTNIDWDFTQK